MLLEGTKYEGKLNEPTEVVKETLRELGYDLDDPALIKRFAWVEDRDGEPAFVKVSGSFWTHWFRVRRVRRLMSTITWDEQNEAALEMGIGITQFEHDGSTRRF